MRVTAVSTPSIGGIAYHQGQPKTTEDVLRYNFKRYNLPLPEVIEHGSRILYQTVYQIRVVLHISPAICMSLFC
jgi:hypothetical protein